VKDGILPCNQLTESRDRHIGSEFPRSPWGNFKHSARRQVLNPFRNTLFGFESRNKPVSDEGDGFILT
jgi:hypothetical protein